MGFLDNVVVPKGSPPITPSAPTHASSSGFLSNVVMPAPGYQAPAPAAPTPSLFQKVVGGVKSAAGDVLSALTAPAPATSFNPMVATNAATGSFLDSLTSAGNQIASNASKAVTDFGSGNFLKGSVDVGQSAFGVLNGLFAPVNSFVAYAQHIPGVGSVATGLNNVFSALATGGADAASGAVSALPVSQETKDIVRPLAEQIGALATQIIAGHAGGEVFKAIGDHSKTLVDTVAKDPTIQEHLARPDEHAPAGDVQTKPAVEPAPTEPGSAEPKGFTQAIPPEAPGAAPEPLISPSATETAPGAAEPPAPAVEPPKPVAAPSGEAKPLPTEPGVSKIGKSIEQKAVDAGISQRFDQTAGFDPITIKDQAARATDLVNTNLDEARAIIRGEQTLPDGLHGVSLVTAMEEYLKKTPDGDIAYELANSPHVSGTSVAAQTMRLAAEREPDSITAKFREVKAAREAALEKQGGHAKAVKKVVDDIQREVKKTATKRPAWEDFIKDVQCNY